MSLSHLHRIDTKELMPQILAFVEKAKVLSDVEQVILFGSMARNEMTSASDVDLAVLINDKSSIELKELKGTLRQFKVKSITWPCDLFICHKSWYENRKEFGGICFSIAAEGISLFDRGEMGVINES